MRYSFSHQTKRKVPDSGQWRIHNDDDDDDDDDDDALLMMMLLCKIIA